MPRDIGLPDALKPLAQLLDESKPNVLMVVGTGISIGATGDSRASWKGLLLDGVNRIESLEIEENPADLVADRILIEKAFTGAFDLDEILQRAESIIKRLGGVSDTRFAAWLKDSVGGLKPLPDRRQSLDAIADLGRAGALILTTNYDSLLSDATGFDPVTWEEPDTILAVVSRQRKGIIHVHGHWSRPSSVVLGRTSYDRIRSAALPQTELKSLWLLWHWLYLGCGSGGLDDPNLGALLEWANDAGLKESSLTDYFLSTPPTINSLSHRFGKSTNLIKYPYADHAVDLSALLQKLAPEARPSPFQRIGPNARRVRRTDESPLSSPFPTWQEFLDGAVPSLAADEEVIRRLETHDWALILDVASVGKTTLAYRIAARPEYRNRPAFYLPLSKATADEAEIEVSPQAAIARLARPGVLLIIDDAHQQPELAHTLWEQWRERPMGSRLIILATRMERLVNLPGGSGIQDLEIHAANPAILVRPTQNDLEPILNYILARIDDCRRTTLTPPQEVLETWHKSFGREIGAFVVAVSQRRNQLLGGNFSLPESAGAEWIKERHLSRLGGRDIENAICLAAFGEQHLELDVPDYALPHPTEIGRLLVSGLAERVSVLGLDFSCYSLREPGWGQLILAAIAPPPNRTLIVTETLSKSIPLALWTWKRIRRSATRPERTMFWDHLANKTENLIADTTNVTLSNCAAFLVAARQQGLNDLVEKLWRALGAQPASLANRAIAEPLSYVAAFLNAAERQGQGILVDGLWRALAVQLDGIAKQVMATPILGVASFLHTAERQDQRDVIELVPTIRSN